MSRFQSINSFELLSKLEHLIGESRPPVQPPPLLNSTRNISYDKIFHEVMDFQKNTSPNYYLNVDSRMVDGKFCLSAAKTFGPGQVIFMDTPFAMIKTEPKAELQSPYMPTDESNMIADPLVNGVFPPYIGSYLSAAKGTFGFAQVPPPGLAGLNRVIKKAMIKFQSYGAAPMKGVVDRGFGFIAHLYALVSRGVPDFPNIKELTSHLEKDLTHPSISDRFRELLILTALSFLQGSVRYPGVHLVSPTLCLAPESCCPVAAVHWFPSQRVVCLYAFRKIPRGAPITVQKTVDHTFPLTPFLPRIFRQIRMSSERGMFCKCALCRKERAHTLVEATGIQDSYHDLTMSNECENLFRNMLATTGLAPELSPSISRSLVVPGNLGTWHVCQGGCGHVWSEFPIPCIPTITGSVHKRTRPAVGDYVAFFQKEHVRLSARAPSNADNSSPEFRKIIQLWKRAIANRVEISDMKSAHVCPKCKATSPTPFLPLDALPRGVLLRFGPYTDATIECHTQLGKCIPNAPWLSNHRHPKWAKGQTATRTLLFDPVDDVSENDLCVKTQAVIPCWRNKNYPEFRDPGPLVPDFRTNGGTKIIQVDEKSLQSYAAPFETCLTRGKAACTIRIMRSIELGELAKHMRFFIPPISRYMTPPESMFAPSANKSPLWSKIGDFKNVPARHRFIDFAVLRTVAYFAAAAEVANIASALGDTSSPPIQPFVKELLALLPLAGFADSDFSEFKEIEASGDGTLYERQCEILRVVFAKGAEKDSIEFRRVLTAAALRAAANEARNFEAFAQKHSGAKVLPFFKLYDIREGLIRSVLELQDLCRTYFGNYHFVVTLQSFLISQIAALQLQDELNFALRFAKVAMGVGQHPLVDNDKLASTLEARGADVLGLGVEMPIIPLISWPVANTEESEQQYRGVVEALAVTEEITDKEDLEIPETRPFTSINFRQARKGKRSLHSMASKPTKDPLLRQYRVIRQYLVSTAPRYSTAALPGVKDIDSLPEFGKGVTSERCPLSDAYATYIVHTARVVHGLHDHTFGEWAEKELFADFFIPLLAAVNMIGPCSKLACDLKMSIWTAAYISRFIPCPRLQHFMLSASSNHELFEKLHNKLTTSIRAGILNVDVNRYYDMHDITFEFPLTLFRLFGESSGLLPRRLAMGERVRCTDANALGETLPGVCPCCTLDRSVGPSAGLVAEWRQQLKCKGEWDASLPEAAQDLLPGPFQTGRRPMRLDQGASPVLRSLLQRVPEWLVFEQIPPRFRQLSHTIPLSSMAFPGVALVRPLDETDIATHLALSHKTDPAKLALAHIFFQREYLRARAEHVPLICGRALEDLLCEDPVAACDGKKAARKPKKARPARPKISFLRDAPWFNIVINPEKTKRRSGKKKDRRVVNESVPPLVTTSDAVAEFVYACFAENTL